MDELIKKVRVTMSIIKEPIVKRKIFFDYAVSDFTENGTCYVMAWTNNLFKYYPIKKDTVIEKSIQQLVQYFSYHITLDLHLGN